MEWGDRRVLYICETAIMSWPRVKELLLLQLQTSVCKNQPQGSLERGRRISSLGTHPTSSSVLGSSQQKPNVLSSGRELS